MFFFHLKCTRFFSSTKNSQGLGMATLSLRCSAHPSKGLLGFYRPIHRITTPWITFLNPGLGHNGPPNHFTLRSRNNVRFPLRQSLLSVCASNGSSEGSDVTKTSEAAKGPPFLTILAGFLVFLAVCCVIGSIVMWLIGLIFHVPSSK